MRTTRRRIADHLRLDARTPSSLSAEFDISVSAALDHVEHIAASLADSEERVAVRPPRCRSCEFQAFDDLLNVPSRCPDCHSEAIEEPRIRIE
ncbi:MAG: transcriptional regulator [Halobacteriaceae archaeon]